MKKTLHQLLMLSGFYFIIAFTLSSWKTSYYAYTFIFFFALFVVLFVLLCFKKSFSFFEKFDNKNRTILEAYEVRRYGLINVADRVYGDGKITPKRWERDMEKAKTDKKNAIEKRPDVSEMALIEAIQYSYEIFQGNGEPCGRDEHMQAISYEEPTRKKTRSDISL